jgi:hypothetical protein
MSASLIKPWATLIGQFPYANADSLNPGLGQHIIRSCVDRGFVGQGDRFPLSTHAHAELERDLRAALPEDFFPFVCVSIARYLNGICRGDYRPQLEDIGWIWPNLSFAGQFHEPHTHSSVHFAVAGVYYVQVPEFERAKEGALSFIDPRGGAVGVRRVLEFLWPGAGAPAAAGCRDVDPVSATPQALRLPARRSRSAHLARL